MISGKIFSKRKARAFEAIFISTFKREIGLQFLMYLLSLSFLSINLIVACFFEEDSQARSQDFLRVGAIS